MLYGCYTVGNMHVVEVRQTVSSYMCLGENHVIWVFQSREHACC